MKHFRFFQQITPITNVKSTNNTKNGVKKSEPSN